jgi:hypothetical protein
MTYYKKSISLLIFAQLKHTIRFGDDPPDDGGSENL